MECTSCSEPLTADDKHEGPDAPEIGWEYYECPECHNHMRPDIVEGDEESATTTASDGSKAEDETDWGEMPDSLSEDEAKVLSLIREEAKHHSNHHVRRQAVISRAMTDLGTPEDVVEDIITELLMAGQCYEPQDEWLAPI